MIGAPWDTRCLGASALGTFISALPASVRNSTAAFSTVPVCHYRSLVRCVLIFWLSFLYKLLVNVVMLSVLAWKNAVYKPASTTRVYVANHYYINPSSVLPSSLSPSAAPERPVLYHLALYHGRLQQVQYTAYTNNTQNTNTQYTAQHS